MQPSPSDTFKAKVKPQADTTLFFSFPVMKKESLWDNASQSYMTCFKTLVACCDPHDIKFAIQSDERPDWTDITVTGEGTFTLPLKIDDVLMHHRSACNATRPYSCVSAAQQEIAASGQLAMRPRT